MRFACVVLAALMMAGSAYAAPAPKVHIATLAELPTPLPYPYEETANADEAIAAAKAKAQASDRLLLIDLGGNWCRLPNSRGRDGPARGEGVPGRALC